MNNCKVSLVIILPIILIISGCKPVDPQLANRINDLEGKLNEQKAQIINLESSNNSLRKDLIDIKGKVAANGIMIDYIGDQNTRPSKLSLTEKNYSVVRTELGVLLFSVDNVAPYANGVKLTFKVGNPDNINYSGLKLKFAWGKGAPGDPAWSGLERKELDLPVTLRGGAWNKVEAVLSPAKPDDVGYVTVSAEVDQVQLRDAR